MEGQATNAGLAGVCLTTDTISDVQGKVPLLEITVEGNRYLHTTIGVPSALAYAT